MKPKHTYTVVPLPAKDAPFTHVSFLEIRDELDNYRGIELGRFKSDAEAQRAVEIDDKTRIDWRTATEIDLAKVA